MSIAFWCGFALLMGLQYQPLNWHNLAPSLVNLLVGMALHGLALAFWTPPVFYLVGKYIGSSKRRFRYALLWSLGAVPFVLLYTTILWVFSPPHDGAPENMSRSFPGWLEMVRGGFADEMFIYIAIVVAAHAYEYLKRVRRQEREKYEYQQALAASELQALKMQLHPHFLFNTLHGIATLIDGDGKNAKAMIIKLSNLLRTALDRDSSDLIPLEHELKFVGEYLDLEEMRFGSRLRVEWSIAAETRQMLVPQMILQPLAENAIRYGVACSREGGWIEIAAGADNGILKIQMRNSVGGTTSIGTGVGLRNAEARLKYLYSGGASLRLTVAEDRTATVRLELPALNSEPAGVHAGRAKTVAAKEGEDSVCAFSSSMTNP
jgi:hypothetical protein